MKKMIKFIIIIFIITSSICLINTTKSRYVSEVNIKNNVSVAIPQIELDTSSLSLTTQNLLPGETTSCNFYVRNYNGAKINEVLMKYYLDIEITNEGFPLDYQIYDVTGGSNILLNKTTEGFGPITLNYGTQEEKKYKILFTWDESKNSDTYANKQFDFKILVNAVQDI